MVALGPDMKQVFPEDRSDPTFNEDAVVEQLLLLQRYICSFGEGFCFF